MPELWSDGTLSQLTGPARAPVLPEGVRLSDGRVYVAGPAKNTRFLTTSGAGSWANGPQRVGPSRE